MRITNKLMVINNFEIQYSAASKQNHFISNIFLIHEPHSKKTPTLKIPPKCLRKRVWWTCPCGYWYSEMLFEALSGVFLSVVLEQTLGFGG